MAENIEMAGLKINGCVIESNGGWHQRSGEKAVWLGWPRRGWRVGVKEKA
jgi:hypothetical protein